MANNSESDDGSASRGPPIKAHVADLRLVPAIFACPDGQNHDLSASKTNWIGCVVEVSTSGPDFERQQIIELAQRRFRFSRDGRVTDVGPSYSWLEDPGRKLSPQVKLATTLRDGDLANQRIGDNEAVGLIEEADLIIAHDARVARPFIERRLKVSRSRWSCLKTNVGWGSYGLVNDDLHAVLEKFGWKCDGFRAAARVDGILQLLMCSLAADRTVLRELLAISSRETWIVELPDAPGGAEQVLRARGYYWDNVAKYWSREIGREMRAAEEAWLSDRVYLGRGLPRFVGTTWRTRFAKQRGGTR